VLQQVWYKISHLIGTVVNNDGRPYLDVPVERLLNEVSDEVGAMRRAYHFDVEAILGGKAARDDRELWKKSIQGFLGNAELTPDETAACRSIFPRLQDQPAVSAAKAKERKEKEVAEASGAQGASGSQDSTSAQGAEADSTTSA
jgi:hypothetical protein